MTDRFLILKEKMAAEGLEMIALNPGASLTYLTGLHFHTSERPTVLLVPSNGKPIIILARLEANKLSHSSALLEAIPYDDNPDQWQDAFRQAVHQLCQQPRIIGVEPTALRFLELNYLQNALPEAGFVSAEHALGSLRAVKDADEIQRMRRAVQIAQDAFLATLPAIKVGVSEQAIAAELSAQLLRHGSQSDFPFAPIIASGPMNSANPHAVPTGRLLETGDLIVIDWGAKYDGYCSDITRTVAVGSISSELDNVANLVLEANNAGRAACRPGIPAGQIDLAARDVIASAGYGDYFNHRVGHGLGMEPHETPYLFGENQTILIPGNVFTVEPGIYLPGKGGVRIEDDVVITSDGAECLTTLPRTLFRAG